VKVVQGGEVTDSKPIWEWMSMSEIRTASIVGLTEPAAKGATVRGTSAAATTL